MGEKSKLIGEYGEKSVENFLKLIGWRDSHNNIEFKCSNENHKKKTHGLDFFFTYKSPLVDLVLKRVHISVKFTDKPYPNSPNSKFKEFYNDLASSIECFKISPESREITSSIKNYSRTEEIGVLFWLSNDEESYDDLISKIASATLSTEYNFDSLFVVDNKRIEFIYNCLNYSSSKFKDLDISFFYPNTGKNIIPTIKSDFGKILPVEYINSSIIPLRLEDKTNNKTTLALFTIERFSTEDLERLISLSKELSKSWSSEILILFPDYNELRNLKDVKIAKGYFEEENFTKNITVKSYKEDFKSLQI
jgi:hypothetical protein